MAVQFSSFSGGPHGLGPVVLPRQEHWLGQLGDVLSSAGNIPNQIQGMQLKRALNDLFLKALNTPTTIEKTVPGQLTGQTLPGAEAPGIFQEYETGTQVPAMGNMFTQEPSQVVQAINPEYADVARKLEVLGYYRPYRGEGTKRYETPEEEAHRAGLKEKAIQEAKAPERDLARRELTARKESELTTREEIAAENRKSAEERARLNREVQESRISAIRDSAQAAQELRTIAAEGARDRARTALLEAQARGDKEKADQIKALQIRLESVQGQIKNPPNVGGGVREWDYTNPKDQTAIRQYIQQENTIMDQLEKLGIEFPERRRLQQAEMGFFENIRKGTGIAGSISGKRGTKGEIIPAPRGATSIRGADVGGVATPTTSAQPTKETVDERVKRLLEEDKKRR